ncbi:cytochrome c oxidase subunit 1, partial [Amycolatopsis sacchari]
FELHYPHMVERLHSEGEITFTGKPKAHEGAKAPSQLLTEAAIPGEHDKDNAAEQ